jgi:predicted dehydrogenase
MNVSLPIRIGIIGCGNVLEAYMPQCEKLRSRRLAEVTLACGRQTQRQRALDLGVPRFTTEEKELVTSSQVDLIIILTSMSEHARLAKAALNAGKHVLLEKPLATNFQDGKELVELANRTKCHLVCGPFTILSPTFQTISGHIARGEIGRPCLARARYGWSGPSWGEWFYKKGGGCLFDLGVYCLASLTGLLGPAQRVMAMTGVAIPEREVNGRKVKVEAEDNAQVLLDFGNALFGVVTSGFTMQQYRNPALEVYGTSGTIQMLGDDWDPDGYELFENQVGAWKIFKETTPDWPWTDGLRHLVECIAENKQPLIKPDYALHVLEIMLKAQQSGLEGRAMDIETTFTLPEFSEVKRAEPVHLQHDRTREHIEQGKEGKAGAP